MNFDSINPATGVKLTTHAGMSDEKAAVVAERAALAQESWRATPFEERTRLMRRAGEVLRDRAEEFARLMAAEMGKPLAGGVAEAEKCAWVCDYYADNAAAQLAPEYIKTDAKKSFVCFQPLGVVLAIMPWNYPFWQVFRFAAPTLMASNAGLLKHAPNVVGCALAIEGVFKEAGFPQNLFRTLV
ncbi:MAG: aldehyde dehydrogenase family protein, partial [Sinobacteraceae bacterium]|nr:aldehyde dehydrogenase family protein [Nevskiaceae bacterium]